MPPNNDNQEIITNPTRIKSILGNIHSSRALLNVTLPGDKNQYNSIILDTDKGANSLTLDELNPREGHDRFLSHKTANIKTTLKGVDVRFNVELIKVDMDNDIAYYIVALPESLDYRQLRAYHRVTIGLSQLPVLLILDDQELIEGELHDISTGGICIRFTSKLPASLKRGMLVPSCMIELPDDNKITAELEIRYLGKADDKGRTLLGGRFVNMNKPQQHMVERYVAKIDRELRRKLPGD